MDDADIFHVLQQTALLAKMAPDRSCTSRDRGYTNYVGVAEEFGLSRLFISVPIARLYAEEYADLATALDTPRPFITKTRSVFSPIEAPGLLIARFRSAGDMYDECQNINQMANLKLLGIRPMTIISRLIGKTTTSRQSLAQMETHGGLGDSQAHAGLPGLGRCSTYDSSQFTYRDGEIVNEQIKYV
ncbi:hypothetical protein B0H13DRAFT_1858908 [Mycena leptocephala]|nr:hypothetical protein B0H13DRAFT_1858908 [Mycena leptocephala]